MRVLIQGINFHPEIIGIGKYTSELALYLSERGHQIRVITAPPYYPQWRVFGSYRAWSYQKENWQGIDILRCPLWIPRKPSGYQRMLHLSSFAFSTLPAMLRQVSWRPDIVFSVAPAISSAMNAILLSRLARSKMWLHVQDFEFDAAIKLGLMPNTNLIIRIAQSFEAFIYKRFDMVSTISERMLERLREKGVSRERSTMLPNWIDPEFIYPCDGQNPFRKALDIQDDQVVILYSGNMGHKQGLEILIDAAKILRSDADLLFILCGEGAVKHDLERSANSLPNLRFMPLQPREKLNSLLNMADIHVLPQRSDAADLVMPSKIAGMLASGRPVIATAYEHTEVGQLVDQVGCLVPPEAPDALAQAIHLLAKDDGLRNCLGRKGRAFVETHWARERILGDFLEKLTMIQDSQV
jgi:colanic acid biosynthesis glycosyl transferase WcaI